MLTAIIFIMILLGCVLAKTYLRLSFAIFISALLLFFTAGCGLLPFLLLSPLENKFLLNHKPSWGTQNAIVVLGAGCTKLPHQVGVEPTLFSYSRIYTAAKLYKACLQNHKCTLILSGGDPATIGVAESVVYQHKLLDLGIAEKDILLETKSSNTYKNAAYTQKILQKHHFDRIFLVTSAFHLRRSLLYFAHFGINAVPIPTDFLFAKFSFVPTSYNLALTDFALHEYIGIARFYVYEFLGWNKQL